MRIFAAEGVDCSGVARVDGGTASVSLILLDAEGEKTIATRRGVGLGQALPENADRLVADADAVLVDNRFPDFVTAVCRAAQARKIPIVIDLDLATKPDDALLKLGTHVIASTEALRATTGLSEPAAALKRLAEHVPGFVAVTDGPNGVYWLENGALRHMPAFAVKAIDTLGAGDAFHGAFTLAMAEGRDLVGALRFASAAAALKCTHFGGAAGAPQARRGRRVSQAAEMTLLLRRTGRAAGRAGAGEILRRHRAAARRAGQVLRR